MDGGPRDSVARVTQPKAGHGPGATPPDAAGTSDDGATEDVVSRYDVPRELELSLTVQDADVIAELVQYDTEDRQTYALRALRIGVLAMRQARGAVDLDAVRREGDRLLAGLSERLGQHAEHVHTRLTDVLRHYFDPSDGRFSERVDKLFHHDGELAGLLRQHVGAEDSELQRTLMAQIGRDSPLMKLLHPEEARGVVAALKDTLESQLRLQKEQVLQQFSLDNRDGALTRFISELTERHGELSERLEKRIDEVVREFSLDSEDSALSRLVHNVRQAQQTITSEFSLDEDTSALSRLRKLLEHTNSQIEQQLSLDDEASPLARLQRELHKVLKEQNETATKFQEEVRVAIESMKARREEADRSTRHGDTFEEAVFAFVQAEAGRMGDIATATGQTTGLIRNNKKGDAVIRLSPDSSAADQQIVVEAKEDRSYTLEAACRELEEARTNRGAQVGVFVFSSRTAPDGLEPVARYGNDIVVVWDAEDARSDVFFKAALSLARALCVRGGKARDAISADFTELDRAINEVEKQTRRLDELQKPAETIQNSASKILDRIRIMHRSLARQVDILRDRTDELREILRTSD